MAVTSVTSFHPVGIFWDIENCQVPCQKSPLQIVQRIRDQFCAPNGKEVEFVCACDVTKERKVIVQALSDAQITLLHVPAISKNAADEKLKTCLHKFSSTYRAPGSVVLITTDVNFAPVITDLRYRFGFHIILIYNGRVSDALYVAAHQRFCWQNDILNSIASICNQNPPQTKGDNTSVLVTELPVHVDVNRIRDRLQRLSVNCGGRVVHVDLKSRTAVLRFFNADSADRARSRIDNEDVFGYKVKARLAEQKSLSAASGITVKGVKLSVTGGSNTSAALFKNIVLLSGKNGDAPTANKDQNANLKPNSFKAFSKTDCDRLEMMLELNKPTERGLNLLNNIFNCHVKGDNGNRVTDNSNDHRSRRHSSQLSSHQFSENSPDSSDFELNFPSETRNQVCNVFTLNDRRSLRAICANNSDADHDTCNFRDDQKLDEANRLLRRLLNQTGMLDEESPSPPASTAPNNSTQPGSSAASHAKKRASAFLEYRNNNSAGSVPNPTNNGRSAGSAGHGGDTLKTKYVATFTNSSRLHPVDVRVDNVDSTMPIRNLKDDLYSMFSAIVRVLHVTVVPQSSGGWFALVQVASRREAIESVNRLNQVKFGKSHIIVSIATQQPFGLLFGDEDLMKHEAQRILAGVPTKSMTLTDFQELLQAKLKRSVSVSEIKTMPDVVRVADGFKAVRCYLADSAARPPPPQPPPQPQPHQNQNHNNYAQCAVDSGDVRTSPRPPRSAACATPRRRSHFCLCTKPALTGGDGCLAPQCLSCCKLRDQIVHLLSLAPTGSVPLRDLPGHFERLHHARLNPAHFGFADLEDMIDDMQGLVQKCVSDDGQMFVKLRQPSHYQETVEAVLHLFLTRPDKELTLREFQDEFRAEFGHELPVFMLGSAMTDIVELFEARNGIIGVRLTPVQKFALRVRRLLLEAADGRAALADLEQLYRQRYNEKLRCRALGFANLIGLLRAASHVLYLKGRGQTLSVCINRNFLGFENKKRPSCDRAAPAPVSNGLHQRLPTVRAAAEAGDSAATTQATDRLSDECKSLLESLLLTPSSQQQHRPPLTISSTTTDSPASSPASPAAGPAQPPFELEPVYNFIVDEPCSPPAATSATGDGAETDQLAPAPALAPAPPRRPQSRLAARFSYSLKASA